MSQMDEQAWDLLLSRLNKNDEDHDQMFERLDTLNGWRNKMLGGLIVAVILLGAQGIGPFVLRLFE